MAVSHVAVIGAGAFGLSTALRLARAGVSVTVFDPAPLGKNASGVAAGMLAPVGEALFDPEVAGLLTLLRAARDAWPAFAAFLPDLPIDRCGAKLLEVSAAAGALDRMGAEISVGADGEAFTPEDWRVDPAGALNSMAIALEAAGGRIEPKSAPTDPLQAFDAVVVAAGSRSTALSTLAPETRSLLPIKGQLLRFPGAGPRTGPIRRTAEGYLVPHLQGAMVGATMEPGESDVRPTPAGRAALLAVAARLHPGLDRAEAQAFAGVRAATPDGLPLAGPSTIPGVFLATGARRNGWLFAPLVSALLAAYLTGEAPGPWAAALDPRRFALS